jgi:hypothetical protein
MFKITRGMGFQMTFDNGWTVSIQFGPENYCDHYHANRGPDEGRWESSCAEIAAWSPGTKNWYVFAHQLPEGVWEKGEFKDHVKGWVNTNEVLNFLNLIANKPKED